MKTSFPGWYQGRATHIHIAAHINGTINKETKTYEGGVTNHIGQVFFPEETLEQIEAVAPYNTNKITRLRNADDWIFLQENTGYDAASGTLTIKTSLDLNLVHRADNGAEIQFLGKSIEAGVLAFISIGIDISANHTADLLNGGMGGMPPNGTFPGFPPNGTLPGMPNEAEADDA
jgi:hypothetical protein